MYTLRYIRYATGAMTGVITFFTPASLNENEPSMLPVDYHDCNESPQNTKPEEKKYHIHHIATDKYKVDPPQWTFKFQDLFNEVGLNLQTSENKVVVLMHQGPHPQEYHQIVYDRLKKSISKKKFKNFQEKKESFLDELRKLGRECMIPGTKLNLLITKKNKL